MRSWPPSTWNPMPSVPAGTTLSDRGSSPLRLPPLPAHDRNLILTGYLAVFLAANDPLNFGVNGTVSDPNGPGVMGQRGSASLQPTRHYGVAGYAQNDTDGIG